MLNGRPVFPGASTMNQLDRIMEATGRPSQADLDAVGSPFAATMMESCSVASARRLADLFPSAPPDALDLLSKLLVFNPAKRLSAAEALAHPYVAQFHSPADEPARARPVSVPVNDNCKYSVADYRERLYGEILRRKRELHARLKAREAARAAAAAGGGGAGGGAGGARASSASGGSARRAAASGAGGGGAGTGSALHQHGGGGSTRAAAGAGGSSSAAAAAAAAGAATGSRRTTATVAPAR